MCQAAFKASKMGDIGQNLAKIASSNADSWLNGINATLHQVWTSYEICAYLLQTWSMKTALLPIYEAKW